MLKSNAIEIIRSLSKQEMAEFNDFLWSPFFNKKTGVIKLFNEISKFSPSFTDSGLEREKLWAKLYPEKEFNYGVMKNLIHDLTKLAEQYVTQVEYRKNEVQEFFNLYKGISNRNLRNVFENKEKSFNKLTSDNYIKNIEITVEEYFHLLTKLYENKTWNSHFYELKVNNEYDRLDMEENCIISMLSHLIIINYTTDVFSIDIKNKTNQNNAASWILNSIPDNIFNDVLTKIKARSLTKYAILNCYYLVYKATNDLANYKHYLNLKDFFLRSYHCLPALTVRDMDVILLNTLSFMQDDLIDKEKEYYELYVFKNNNNLVLDKNKQINSLQFLPWSVTFLEENKPEELKDFIHKYGKYLIDDQKQSTLLAVEAVHSLMINDYDNALKQLSKTKFELFLLKNFVKKVTLLVNYESGDYESFLNNIDSLNHFLSYSEKEAKIERATSINRTKLLIKYLNKLFLLKESSKPDEILFLKKEVQNIYIDFKKWFLRKINELKKS